MQEILGSKKMDNVHSDIRGPLFIEANEMQNCGLDVLKLNTGNPASFGFKMPEGIHNVLKDQLERAVGYCDFRGMPDARSHTAAVP